MINLRMSESRMREMKKYFPLREAMLTYEDKYFLDMTFRDRKLINNLFTTSYEVNGKEEQCVEDELYTGLKRWLIVYTGSKYKLEKGVYGLAGNGRIIIATGQDKTEEKHIILHEMIHAYEEMLPEHLRQLLTIFLYDQLVAKINKKNLLKLIYSNSHVNLAVPFHGPLFMLKALDLDLRLKLPLGTVFAYGREEYFKDK